MTAQLQSNGVPYKSTGMGAYTPPNPVMPNMSISDYLQTLQVTPSLNLPALNPAGLAFADGMPLAPTIGSSTGSTSGLNLDWMNPSSEGVVGNSLGLNIGATAGGVKPIALTDKINAGVGVFNSALGALSAYKAYQLGKDNLNFQKDAFAKNYEVQKNLTNSELEARQGRLNRGRPDIHSSVSDYMAQYGVK